MSNDEQSFENLPQTQEYIQKTQSTKKRLNKQFTKYSVIFLAKIIFLVVTIAISQGQAFAQEITYEPEIIPANTTRCQRNTINIFGMGSSLYRETKKIFVIARLGDGETSTHLNRRRLDDVKTEFGNHWNPDKIILAEGEKVKGLGRVEFYREADLSFVSLIPRNGDICSLCCDRKKVFYEVGMRTGKLPGKEGWLMEIDKPSNKQSQRKLRNKLRKTH
jgi:hypothetical protein